MERTLSIIKPDAVRGNHIGAIVRRLEDAGLRVIAMKMVSLSQDEAADFYAVHRARPFYQSLVSFISSGPVVVMALEGDKAITRHREIMGHTDPAKAQPGTIRDDFAMSIDENAIHGSDSPQTATEELSFFFTDEELYPRMGNKLSQHRTHCCGCSGH
jgi:nucleoside-diphosphate kinase